MADTDVAYTHGRSVLRVACVIRSCKRMLDSLRITDFRAFENLEVQRLGRVNLVVGRNNVGKTTLLEGVHLHASGRRALEVTQRLLRRRDAYVRATDTDPGTVDFEQLFFGDGTRRASELTISAASGEDPLRFNLQYSRLEHSGEEQRRIFGDAPPPRCRI